MANYLDNTVNTTTEDICAWVGKYNALCSELQGDNTAIVGAIEQNRLAIVANTTAIAELQSNYENLLTNIDDINFGLDTHTAQLLALNVVEQQFADMTGGIALEQGRKVQFYGENFDAPTILDFVGIAQAGDTKEIVVPLFAAGELKFRTTGVSMLFDDNTIKSLVGGVYTATPPVPPANTALVRYCCVFQPQAGCWFISAKYFLV